MSTILRENVSPELRALRQRIVKKLQNQTPDMQLDVIHWIYVDLVLFHAGSFEDCMEIFNSGREIGERCARRYHKRES